MEQKLHIDFDLKIVPENNTKKMSEHYLPFSLLFPIENDVELTICQYEPTNIQDVRKPFSVKGTTIYIH